MPESRILLVLFALLLLCAAVEGAIGPIADLHISNEILAPDGFDRSTVVAGGTFPGPAIIGTKGDIFVINVTNALHDPSMLRATTIHWHGIVQRDTNWLDGPAMVTQCPIVPGDSFVYNFPVCHQAGTFWYHSHYESQYCDGLRGPFIVYDPNDPYQDMYDYDNETTIITLADWYHEPAPSRIDKPITTLINGLGRAVNGTASELAIITVEQNKRYRFRIIGLSCDPSFNFTIHNHKLTVIETDGEYTEPLVVDSIEILHGTYDTESLLPDGSIYKLPPNKSVELVIYGNGTNGGPHTFHVVRSGRSNTYNWINPVRRDTVDTGLDDGETTIRFFTDNPGPWFLHWQVKIIEFRGIVLINIDTVATLIGISRLVLPWCLRKILKEQEIESDPDPVWPFALSATDVSSFNISQRPIQNFARDL
ncbi:hypothetical protein H0H93_009464 [Arthromyces matolae]|nr:hypothetical protein H0H93_009464 [Arthromyces matolae]